MRFYKEQSELFEGIQNGDADAFEYVFKTYYLVCAIMPTAL